MSNRKILLVIGLVLIGIAFTGLFLYCIDENRKEKFQQAQLQKEQELAKSQAIQKEKEAEIAKQKMILQQEQERAIAAEKSRQAENARQKIILEQEQERAKAAEESKKIEIEKQKAAEKQRALLQETEKYQAEERKRIAEQEQARKQQEHEDLLNRYIANRSFKNLPDSQEVAVLVVDDDRERQNLINQEIISVLKKNNFKPTTFLFTDQFVADGIFEKIFNGNFYDISQLELQSHCDHLIIGKVSTNFLKNPDMVDMITAKLDLNLHVISAQTAAATDLIIVSGKGVGFSKETAKNNALKGIFEQIDQRLVSALF